MNSKILLLSIAVISVGLFAMPSTLSLFAGQHTFDKAGNTTICAKCHSDVLSEINNGAYHKSLVPSVTAGNECKGCHTSATVNTSAGIPLGNGSNTSSYSNYYLVGLNIADGNFTQANGTNLSKGVVHAAVTVECKSCHYAVSFTNDAHKTFADNTTSEAWLLGANEACVGCHTKAQVYMTWTRKVGYNYTFRFNDSVGTLTANNNDNTSSTPTSNQ